MEDRQIRIALQVYLSSVALILLLFTGGWEIFVIGLIIANGLGYASAPISNFLLVLECLGSIFKRCCPDFAEAPAPLDLAFPWISITGRKMPDASRFK